MNKLGRIIDGIEYFPRTRKETPFNGGESFFYPVVEFMGSKIHDEFYINEPQPTRAKAFNIAVRYIKNIGK